MRLLRGTGTWILAAGIWAAGAGGAHAQSTPQNSQQQNGNTGASPSQTNNNVPYNPPAPPPGGYGDAATGSYTGRGSSGYGSGAGSTQNGGSGGYGLGQNSGSGGMGRSAAAMNSDELPQNQLQLEQQQARARNTERQRQLVADTQKLVALAHELQAEVNQSTKDTLSLDVVRKADEIDKLARSVRDRMKNAN